MPFIDFNLVDDMARVVSVVSSFAMTLALVRLLYLRRDMSLRLRFLVFLLAALMLTVGMLSLAAAIDYEGVAAWVQTTIRFGLAMLNVVGAVALWTNLKALVSLPSPVYVASEQRRLALELATALQRYEMALRGSNVSIFTQDRELRYTSISKPLFGFPVEQVLGASDAELLGEMRARSLVLLKREALASNEPRKGEVEVEESGTQMWYDVHIEPLRDLSGTTVGLTGAAVDITERKENERHLRLLMRELTHRSKNLLAVIQAMARQTARHAATIDHFVEQFSARLQALSRSHDLLVQESWHGASLHDMVRSQLGHHLDPDSNRISIAGPELFLKPEAAQNIGLALHELSTNAVKYGALSVPAGKVAIHWARRQPEAGGGFELSWKESGGPPVKPPTARGFGSLVIERNLARGLDGEVELAFNPDGLACHVSVPEHHLSLPR
ncbi:HWE histidine kinase domain-containing protein [Ancylobacter oerskovii]|uniref:Blue-light-activated histidine kinase n=1 Tax=Ancylobacter oerskovii TaxID=459519 RepID=A0ABW4YX06_9HYPH|nr:HWE histidine kinase domain-containing protein [Ancylobacter oerskovii]MBS7542307.1 PAS domain-containing protein [Ancylobacter oerskovii]